uniref:Uncharacterized protein n=1 Tax=Caenorhabditis tropicalis TaxID=1561998 RepID=A0A1I7T4D1_9PELO
MFSPITIVICMIFVCSTAEAGRNYNYNYGNNRGNYYYQNQYPASYNRGYNNYYQGYRAPYRGYQGFGNNYQYQRQYQGYGNNYYYPNSYAQPAPAPQPSLAQLLFGPPRQSSYTSSNGINYDSYGNSFVGTKDNGIYLFCNGRGCPGRG